MKEFLGSRAKTQSSLIDNGSEDKKAKLIKRKFKYEGYKNCSEATQLEINRLEKMKLT